MAWDMIKGVSDLAVALSRDLLRRNIIEVSEKIAQLLWNEIR